jgi:ribosomal protein S7
MVAYKFKHYKQIGKSKKRKLIFWFYRFTKIFFGSLVFRGRKLWAYNFLLNLKFILKKKTNIAPNFIFLLSLLKICPLLMLAPFYVGGKKEGVPIPIRLNKQLTFTTKWIIKLLRDKNKRLKLKDVANVLILSHINKGESYKKKIKSYNMSIYNRYLIFRYLK